MHQWRLKVPLTAWWSQWFLNLLQPVVLKISQESRRKIDEIAKTDQGSAKVGMENFGVLRNSTVSWLHQPACIDPFVHVTIATRTADEQLPKLQLWTCFFRSSRHVLFTCLPDRTLQEKNLGSTAYATTFRLGHLGWRTKPQLFTKISTMYGKT